ncbi:MAG: hypothetical protein EXR73_11810 [Myxococcales bacterium]|nr:hypothetical protein [Myxococcales bacterium]
MTLRPLLCLALTVSSPFGCVGSSPEPPAITAPFADDFTRADLGGDYHATAPDAYRISGGALGAQGAYNHPLWLRRKLPTNAVIEFDCWANSPDGDLKIEAWGDGRSYAKDKGAYAATGYVFVLGGHQNTESFLARLDEHGADRKWSPRRAEIGHRYHFKIVRQGGRLDWFVDDMAAPFLTFEDPAPLAGPGHDHFGFNDWQSELWFDNLVITPL